jgi:hypothetical protein
LLPAVARRELYEHAGLPGEWSELAPGHAERLIGAVMRELPASDPRWRRVWAAWSATRACRKRLLPGFEQEQYALEWVEWGMRQ